MLFPIKNSQNFGVEISQSKVKVGNGFYYFFELDFSRGKKDFDKFSFLHLSDTHFKNSKNSNELISSLSFLEDMNFDFIFHTGDVIDKNLDEFLDFQKDFLKDLNSKNKFYVNGNHEFYDENSKELEVIMQEDLDFVNLTNKFEGFNLKKRKKKVCVFGLDDYLFGERKVFFDEVEEDNFNILLVHNLDSLHEFDYSKFDLILSGHLHSGEMNFGVFDGCDYLKLKKHYNNFMSQKRGFKFLKENILSFSHPGMYTHVKEKYGLDRMFVQKEGIVIFEVKY